MYDLTRMTAAFASPEKAIKEVVAFNTDIASTVFAAQSKLAGELYSKYMAAFATPSAKK